MVLLYSLLFISYCIQFYNYYRNINSFSKEELRAQRIAEFQVRVAKRARKGKKLRAVRENSDHGAYGKRKKRKFGSSFTNELTDVRKKAVKRFRYG